MKRKRKETQDMSPSKKTDLFSIAQFKTMMRDPSTSVIALEKFLAQAQMYPSQTTSDLVASYCKSSAECEEIFKFLEAGKKKPPELCLVFRVLEGILLRIADDLPQLRLVSQHVVRRLLAAHLGTVYYMLSPGHKSNQIKAALKLLTAMVMQGEGSAREVQGQFNFAHSTLPQLLRRKDTKDLQDVRTCLLHFMMSFLISGDDHVIRKLVDTKGFLTSMFPELKCDKLTAIHLVLVTLNDKVVQNASVSKTSKLHLFNTQSLRQLAALYQWKGEMLHHGDKAREEPMEVELDEASLTEDQHTVRELVHTLLLEVCCSFKHGINFFDKTFSTSGKNQNSVLSSFLQHFSKPQDDVLTRELVTHILVACPDQLHWYLPSLKHLVVPRLSPNYIQCCQFLKQIYAAQPAVSPALKLNERVPISKLVAMAMATLMPPKEIWGQVVAAVRSKTSVIQHTGLDMVALTLKRVAATLTHFMHGDSLYTPQEMAEFVEALRQALLKSLPDVSQIVQCWTQSSDNSLNGDETSGNSKQSHLELPTVDTVEHQVAVLQVLCAYQSCFPSLLREHPLDFTPLLEGIQWSDTTQGDEDAHSLQLLQLLILKLLSESSLRQLPWLKQVEGKRSTLYLLLKMVVATSGTMLASTTRRLLQKLLASTGLFPNTEAELTMWLHHLSCVDAAHQESVVKFFESILVAVVCDPYTYTESISELVVEARLLCSKSATENLGWEANGASVTTGSSGVVDTILSMKEVPLAKEDDKAPWNAASVSTAGESNTRFPFSCLVPAVFDHLSSVSMESADAVHAYGIRVLGDILHTQLDPTPLCLLLEQKAKELRGSVKLQATVDRLLPSLHESTPKLPAKKKQKKGQELSDCSSLSEILSCHFEHGQAMSLTEGDRVKIVDLAAHAGQENALNLTKQVLLYLRRTVADFTEKSQTAEKSVVFYMEILKNVVKSMATATSEVVAGQGDLGVDLQTLEVSSDGLLTEAFSLILQHSVLKEVFLPSSVMVQEQARHIMAHEKLVEITASQMREVLSFVPSSSRPQLEWYCTEYVELVEQVVLETVDSTDVLTLGKRLKPLMIRLEAFLEHVPPQSLLRLCELLLTHAASAPGEQEGTHQGNPGCQLVLKAMHLLLSGENSHLLKLYGLSHEAVGNFLHLLLHMTETEGHSVTNDSWHATQAAMLLSLAPCYAVAATERFTERCLSSGIRDWVAVVAQCMQHSPACHRWFGRWSREKLGADPCCGDMRYLLSVRQYMMGAGTDSTEGKATCKLLKNLYASPLKMWVLRQLCQDEENGEDFNQVKLDVLILCMKKAFDKEEVESLWQELSARLTKKVPPTSQQIDLYNALAEMRRASSISSVAVDAAECLLLALVATLKSGPEDGNDLLQKILEGFCGWLHEAVTADECKIADVLSAKWQDFVKHGLKKCFGNSRFLRLLCDVIHLVYGSASTNPDLTIDTVFNMVLSHSQFLPTLMGEKNDAAVDVKECIIDVLLVIAKRQPLCCKTPHVAMLLGAYGATLSSIDQKLLLLMQLYENSGCSLAEYRPYMWGAKAVDHQTLKQNLGPSLWKEPSSTEVLELLDKTILQKSIVQFPLRRTLKPEQFVEPESLKSCADVYDPCFLLPVFSHLLSPASFVNCAKFVEHGCLGYVLAGLSAHNSELRSVSYHLLRAYQTHLDGSRFPEKTQVAYLLECLQNSVAQPGAKLPCVVTAFLARTADMLLKPENHMYQLVNSFLLLKPSMDVANIPDFYKLFNSSSLEHKLERFWMLSLMLDGLRETADYHIYQKRHAWKLLLGFGQSAFCDAHAQSEVLEIVKRASLIKGAAFDLVKHQGLLAWINGQIATRCSTQTSAQLIGVLYTLWFTMLDKRDERPRDVVQKPLLPPLFTNEIMLVLLSLLRKMRVFPSGNVLLSYAQCLLSVLTHQAKTQLCLGQSTGSSLAAVSLSDVDVLLLLSADAALNDQVERVVETEKLLSSRGLRVVSTEEKAGRKPVEIQKETMLESNGGVTAKMRTDVSNHLLRIVAMWKPTKSSTSISTLTYVWTWAMQKLESHPDMNLKSLHEITQWIEVTLLPLAEVRTQLLQEKEPYLVSRTLTVYGEVEKLLSKMAPDLEMALQVQAAVNRVFRGLLMQALLCTSDESKISRLVQRTEYFQPLRLLEKLSVTSETDGQQLSVVAALVKELWLGAKSPYHFKSVVSNDLLKELSGKHFQK